MKLLIRIFIAIIVFFFTDIIISFSDQSPRSTEYQNEADLLNMQGSNEIDYNYLHSIDSHVSSLIKNYNIKGASVAVCKDEHLVYARGFGYADMEEGSRVGPEHLFRIASISKLITAVAIMKLIEEEKLSLDDNIFGPYGILPYIHYPEYSDIRVEKITIRHLLNHTAGWSRKHGDPMFDQLNIARKFKVTPPISLDTIIQYMLSKKLDFEPGKVYSYSNFGYAILGEIISIKTGLSYEDYVLFNIMKPLGIQDMHIGRSYMHQKFPNEVKYYENNGYAKCFAYDGSGELVPRAYGGNNIELMAAAGGWIASAPELAKFLTAIDGSDNQPDILKKETIRMMIDPLIAGNGLFGWKGADQFGNSWRTGTLAGSTSLVMKQSNGIIWVVLLNTSVPYKIIHNRIAGTMFTAQKYITEWPDINLFSAGSYAQFQ